MAVYASVSLTIKLSSAAAVASVPVPQSPSHTVSMMEASWGLRDGRRGMCSDADARRNTFMVILAGADDDDDVFLLVWLVSLSFWDLVLDLSFSLSLVLTSLSCLDSVSVSSSSSCFDSCSCNKLSRLAAASQFRQKLNAPLE